MKRMYNFDDYSTMGLDVLVGAASAEDRIQAIDDKVHGHDGAVYKWNLDTYGPNGVAAAHTADNNTVEQEQNYLKGWAAFRDDWANWSGRVTKALLDEQGLLGGHDELAAALSKDIDKREIEAQSWIDRFVKVREAHGKKVLPLLLGRQDFPWAKVLFAIAAIGTVGGVCLYLKSKSDEAKAEALKAGTDGARGLRAPSMSVDDRPTIAEPMMHGMTLGPPEPMPQLNLAPINGRRR